MNFDELISKYLDGELTEHEDTTLRQTIKDDPFMKKEFDRAVVLNYAIKETAKNDKMPEDIARDTQDMVLMKIFNEQPIIREKLRRRTAYRRAISLVAATLILGFAAIDDLPLLKIGSIASNKNISNITIDNNIDELEAQTGSAQKISKTQRNEVNYTKAQRNAVYVENSISNSLNMTATREALNMLNPKLSDKGLQVLSELVASDMNTNPNITDISVVDGLIDAENNKVNDDFAKKENNIFDFNNSLDKLADKDDLSYKMNNTIQNTNVNNKSSLSSDLDNNVDNIKGNIYINNALENQSLGLEIPVNLELTTNISSPMMCSISSDIKKSYLSSFSQSFGYRIADVHGIGVEFGYINLNFDETVYVKIPVSSKVLIYKDNNLDPNTEVTVPQQSYKENKTLWGALYYKYDIIKSNIFRLNSTIGIGGTGEGLLNFGRINCSVRVLDYIVLNLGLDGKLFYSSLPYSTESTKKLQSALSLVYGVSFKF